jgi:hypothetical protein
VALLTLERRLSALRNIVRTDMEVIHQLLNGPNVNFNPRNRACKVSTERQAIDPALRIFIMKYGGDADASESPRWLNGQLQLVNSIKAWSYRDLIDQVEMCKQEWEEADRERRT